MDNELNQRIGRIYAALVHVIGPKVREVPVSATQLGGLRFIEVDFRDGLSDEELSNRAHGVIHNVANLKGHLIRWSKSRGLTPGTVEQVVDGSPALKLVIDLSNNDKHGYPPRDRGKSGLSPKLAGLDRWLSMATGPEAGSSVGFTMGPDGIGRIVGDGSAAIVITGRIIDDHGSQLGDLDAVLLEAIEAWERFLAQHAA